MPTSAEYMRDWRRRNPDAYAREKSATAARKRALEELADMFPEQFEQLENRQREREGLPPVQRRGYGTYRRVEFRRPGSVVIADESRVCSGADCSTVLSQYNPNRFCASCERKATA